MPGKKDADGYKINCIDPFGTKIALKDVQKTSVLSHPHGKRRITEMTGLLLIGLGLLLAIFAIATALRPEMPVETFWG